MLQMMVAQHYLVAAALVEEAGSQEEQAQGRPSS